MADRIGPMQAVEDTGWNTNNDGSVALTVSDMAARSTLLSILTSLAAIEATLLEIQAALEGTLDVKLIP